jgi:hypothetical protein
MKDSIYKNLYLKIDYEQIKSDAGIISGNIFYLIGTLPLAITYPSKNTEIAKVNVREKIEKNDPQLRNMLGIKASECTRDRYKEPIKEMVLKLEKILMDTTQKKEWRGKTIENIAIINFHENRQTLKV